MRDGGGGVYFIFMHGRSGMAIDPRGGGRESEKQGVMHGTQSRVPHGQQSVGIYPKLLTVYAFTESKCIRSINTNKGPHAKQDNTAIIFIHYAFTDSCLRYIHIRSMRLHK